MTVSRLEKTFATLREAKRTALMPYLTMGYPERDSALTLVPAIAEAGADLIELGVPFSDPLADGATIQAASQQALANGMSLDLCLDQAADLRHHGTEIPFVLMGYYNPIYQYGIERFAQRAAASGIDGLIVPDLPPEESGGIQEPLRSAGIDLVFLLAPTSSEARIRQVVETSGGFVYLVSLVGVTGARSQLDQGLSAFVRRVRTATDKPLAVGFGISRPEQAAAVARIADGVIVGSALIKAIGSADDPVTAAQSFTRSLREGINGAS